MRTQHVPFALVFSALVVLTTCSKESHTPADPQDKLLKIYYLWTASGDPHQHSSIKTGVEKAKNKDEIRKLIEGKVTIEARVDPDTKEEAIALAQELRRNPGTLAVIGNTYSGTTWATLPIFADAGIPVFVTNATSPYLFMRHAAHDKPNLELARGETGEMSQCERPDCYFEPPGVAGHSDGFHNALRLVPADVPDQVSAIQLTINQPKGAGQKKKGSKPNVPRVMLICDQTGHNGAGVYSKPMCDYLERFTTHQDLRKERNPDYKVVSSRNIDLDHGDLWGLVTEIRAAHPDYIVLVGYDELARDVLQGLAERDPKGYKFIITDGAFSDTLREINPHAEIYFTSPAHPHKKVECDSVEGLSVTSPSDREKEAQKVPETTDAFAYDSVAILANAVNSCSGRLDRACLLDFFARNQNLTATCETYDFHDGERQHAAYYVYSEKLRKKGVTFEPEWCAKSEDQELSLYSAACGRRQEYDTSGKQP